MHAFNTNSLKEEIYRPPGSEEGNDKTIIMAS